MWAMSTSEVKDFPAPYHHGDLRAALVNAATELVTCCGPAAVSLREVARMAGVSHNAPYRHFPTRQALLAAVAAKGFEMLGATLHDAVQHPDPAGRLQCIARGYINFALDRRGIYQLMFSAEIRKDEHPELQAVASAGFQRLESSIASVNPKLDSRYATITAWSLLHGIAHLILDQQLRHETDGDERHAAFVHFATSILAAGLAHAEPEPPAERSTGCPG
jgi:AcrR family transcriptional regulator